MSVHQPVTIGHYTHCAERDVIAALDLWLCKATTEPDLGDTP